MSFLSAALDGQNVQFERCLTLCNALAHRSRDDQISLKPRAETRSGPAVCSV